MTIYIRDFENDIVGQQPEGWSEFWHTENGISTTITTSNSYNGKAVEVLKTVSRNYALTLDQADNSSNVEILARSTRNKLDTTTGYSNGVTFRASGDADNESCYCAHFFENFTFRIAKWNNGIYSILQSVSLEDMGISELINNPQLGLWIKFRASGQTLTVKAWIDGKKEPDSWQITRTDTDFTSGKCGLWHYDGSPINYFDYVAIATNGQSTIVPVNPWIYEKEPPSFLNVIRHLLPNAKAWWLTPEKNLKKFFRGLSDMPQDIRDFYNLIFNDLDPQKTRQLDEWEEQFGLPPSFLDEQERRDRLEATWKNQGGQSPYYIQTTLQNAGFNVYVHEWWQEGTDPPVARDPTTLLSGSEITYLMIDGALIAQDGHPSAMDGKAIGLRGYPLVNKPEPGGGYTVPSDPNTFPYYCYVGSETFPEVANVPQSRRDEFEQLLLKIGPTHLWIGVLVEYT